MIDFQELIDEVHKEFKYIDRRSIEKICKTGLARIRGYTYRGQDVTIIGGEKGTIFKFFIPMTPEDNNLRNGLYLYRKGRLNSKNNSENETNT